MKQIITFLLLNFTIAGYACSCKSFTAEEHISNSEIIFSGTVTNVQSCEMETNVEWRTESVLMYTFEISNAYKNINIGSIEIITKGIEACGDSFSIGEEYIIFAHDSGYSKKNDGIYETGLCSWNIWLCEFSNSIEFYSLLKASKTKEE